LGIAVQYPQWSAATEGCAELGIQFLTLYAFSTENWSRPKEEVDALMELMVETIHGELETLMKNNIRLRTIGEISQLPPKCFRELKDAMDQTQNNNGLTLIIAVNYSSRWELTEAMKKIAHDIALGDLNPNAISEKTISSYLETHDYPDPELMIRTNGEQRLSNYLLATRLELYFTPVLARFYEGRFIPGHHRVSKTRTRFGKTVDN
jgi:undecaprenyl diphosphate synthase